MSVELIRRMREELQFESVVKGYGLTVFSGTEPEKFMMPKPSDLRFSWVVVRLAAIDGRFYVLR